MTTEDIIIQIFIEVDDLLPDLAKHPQAKLHPSELVTVGILFALKPGHFRAFYRCLKRDHEDLFAGLPKRSRLQRLLKTYQDRVMLCSPSQVSSQSPTVIPPEDVAEIVGRVIRVIRDELKNKTENNLTVARLEE